MDIRNTLAAQNYAATKAVTGADPTATGGAVFDTAKDFITTLQQSEATAMASMTSGADPHSPVQVLAQTEMAVQSVVAVRDKVVEAYQELLRMPI
jgi:flagellar hook-basal body complex protein FliE